uniref:Uncharacterized protein n=1 Tax=Candidatus Kentrum eta TaxID=2126337 RepID=A0A450VD88_9GAMM|nr:MAG: hypothetical protein BECKH772B_GA0070898_101035 [Candidatus Kentron sp. H]VFK02769.1 MAG: hypothetical protein BECKH772C_GA0070978_101025 [Candidatus Kentron sp. H]
MIDPDLYGAGYSGLRSCLEIRNLLRQRPNCVLPRCDGGEVRYGAWASCSPLQSLIFAPIAPCGSHNREHRLYDANFQTAS